MPLKYDFDMFTIMPDAVQSQFREQINELGLTQMMSQQIALFRDPNTAEALRQTDPVVQQFFLDAGFGMNTYSSGAPDGRYFKRDEDARVERMMKLADLMMERSEDLRGANWGSFEYGQFLEALEAAEPIDEIEVPQQMPPRAKRASGKKTVARLVMVCGLAMIAYAVNATLL